MKTQQKIQQYLTDQLRNCERQIRDLFRRQAECHLHLEELSFSSLQKLLDEQNQLHEDLGNMVTMFNQKYEIKFGDLK
jgi:predicted rRNA methylase YqxC with S4 and FtsJ domains